MITTIPERLKVARLLQTVEDCEAFEDALAELAEGDLDPALLPALLECFDDRAQTTQPELMWQLLHLVESFEMEAYLLALIKKTSYLQEYAPDWLLTLWARTLNGDEARTRLQHEIFPLLPGASDVRAYLLAEPALEAQARSLF